MKSTADRQCAILHPQNFQNQKQLTHNNLQQITFSKRAVSPLVFLSLHSGNRMKQEKLKP